MINQDIEQKAKEFAEAHVLIARRNGEFINVDHLRRAALKFALSIVAGEREACAKIADDLARRTREEWEENPLLSLRGTENCEAIRDAIRARGENSLTSI